MVETEPVLTLEELHESLVSAPVALGVIDADGRVRDVNAAAVDLIGFHAPEQVIGESMLRFLPPEDADLARRRLQILVDGIVDGFTLRARNVQADGGVIETCQSARRVRTPQGPVVVLCLLPGEANTELAWTEPVGRSQLAVLTTDHDWRIVDTSTDVDLIIGADQAALAGFPLLGLLHPLDVGGAVVALAELIHDHDASSVGVRFGWKGRWRTGLLTMVKLCSHSPPRLACALSTREEAVLSASPPSPDATVMRLVAEAVHGEILPDLAKTVLQQAAKTHQLTAHELELVVRLMRGQSVAEISAAVFLSVGTIRNQLSEIYRKFGVHSRAALLGVIYAGHEEVE